MAKYEHARVIYRLINQFLRNNFASKPVHYALLSIMSRECNLSLYWSEKALRIIVQTTKRMDEEEKKTENRNT